MRRESLVLADHLGVPENLLDRGKQQRRSVSELSRDLPRPRHRPAFGHDIIHQPPVPGLLNIHETAGHQKFDRDMIGDAAAQFDRARVRQHADIDLGQRELRMVLGHDDVAAEHDLEPAAAGDAVDRGDDGLVEIARMVEPAETAAAPVGVRRLALRRRLQVPARAEKFVARACDNGDAQRGIIAETFHDLVQPQTGLEIDRIGLRPVDGDFENAVRAPRPNRA